MKAAIITDTHWGVRGDSKQFLDFFEKFYNNVFFPKLIEEGITTIFHLGDIVDRRKFINYVTLHHFKNIFINRLEELGITMHVIVGNHDIPYRNTNSINAMMELFRSPNIITYADPKDVEFDGVSIAMLPWINNENYTSSMEFVKKTKSQILFGHLELAGFSMYRGLESHDGMDPGIFNKFDMVCSGHFHHKSSNGNIHYLGNPYELNWNDYNDNRGFHIFDSETREIDFIQNPYRMFHKVWYDDVDTTLEKMLDKYDFSVYNNCYVKVIVQNKINPYWFDIMMDNLYKENPANVSIVEDNKHMDALQEEDIINEVEDTLTTLHNYVDTMNTDIDKKKLNLLFSNLYIEAQTFDSVS